MSKLCTLIAIPSEIIEGSTYDVLNKRWPQAACHDGINKIFNGYDPEAINPLVVADEFPAKVDEENYIDRLVTLLAPILYDDDRVRAIHIEKGLMSQLYNHPAYQDFCEEKNPIKITNINKEP